MFSFIEQDTISVLIRNEYIGEKLSKTPGGVLFEEAQQRWTGHGKGKGYFTREDWRVIQPNIINLPRHCLKNKVIMEKLDKAFNDESAGLYVWGGAYHGGLEGTGVDFKGQMPVEELIL